MYTTSSNACPLAAGRVRGRDRSKSFGDSEVVIGVPYDEILVVFPPPSLTSPVIRVLSKSFWMGGFPQADWPFRSVVLDSRVEVKKGTASFASPNPLSLGFRACIRIHRWLSQWPVDAAPLAFLG